MPDVDGILLPSEEKMRVQSWIKQRCTIGGETRMSTLWQDFDQWQRQFKYERPMIRIRWIDVLNSFGYVNRAKYLNWADVREISLRT